MIFEKSFHLDPHFPLVHHLEEALTILAGDLDGFDKHVHLTVVCIDAVLHPVSDGLLIVVLRSHEVNQVVHRSLSFKNLLSDRTCLIQFFAELQIVAPNAPNSERVSQVEIIYLKHYFLFHDVVELLSFDYSFVL